MKRLSIVFEHYQNPSNKIEVFWQIDKTVAASFWAKLLKNALLGKNLFHPRFTGFLYGPKDMKFLVQNLNKCIDRINQEGTYKIEERATLEWDQEFSNKIHHHFEILCGTVEKPTNYLLSGDLSHWNAVLGLNQIIHDMEALEKAKARQSWCPDHYFSSIIVQVFNAKRFHIPHMMDDQFSIATKFGAIHLNYSQIGKTWWEVYLDQDEEIFPEAIVPHFAIDGGFDIFFGEYNPSKNEILDFHSFLRKQGLDPNDKTLRLGYCQVAQLEEPDKYTREQWRKIIGEHSKICHIKLWDDHQVVAEQVIDYQSPYESIYESKSL